MWVACRQNSSQNWYNFSKNVVGTWCSWKLVTKFWSFVLVVLVLVVLVIVALFLVILVLVALVLMALMVL